MLQRYFFRPKREPFISLKYNEYYEQCRISKTCPKGLQHHFPALFPTEPASQSSRQATCGFAPALDCAPAGQQHFVYEKQRGDRPICRLEMKYPKQKEVFYLRHMLLNHAKSSFDDCRCPGGKTCATIEEAMVSTGYFAGNDEAPCVLSELVALRYTAAQLRFAFVALLEQDARPVTLYKTFEKSLCKDFLDRGMSLQSARHALRVLLHSSCQFLGKSVC